MRSVAIVALSLVLLQGAWNPARAESAPSARKADCDRAAYRVVLDVGHTLEAPGAVSARGVTEYEFNLRLAKLIEGKLIAAGFAKTVLLITSGQAMAGLIKRVAAANSLPADLFVSIHHDSVPEIFKEKWEQDGREYFFSDRFNGHSIFVSNSNGHYEASLAFGRLFGQQLKARFLRYTPHYTQSVMGKRRRQLVDKQTGVYRFDQLYVLRATRMPAVLFEAGLIINRDEELMLSFPEYQANIAAAMTDAIAQFCAASAPKKPEAPKAAKSG